MASYTPRSFWGGEVNAIAVEVKSAQAAKAANAK